MNGRFILRAALALFAVTLGTSSAYAGRVWLGMRNGDLVFQDRRGSLADILKRADETHFTHGGIARPTGGGFFIADATPNGGVFEESMERWIDKGRNGDYWVFRYDGLPYPPGKNHPAVETAYAEHLAKPYDPFFLPDRAKLYDAEFLHLIYAENGVELGKRTSLRKLGVRTDEDLTKLFGTWQTHPLCRNQKLDRTSCRATLLNLRIYTPASIANDGDLHLVYSNAKLHTGLKK